MRRLRLWLATGLALLPAAALSAPTHVGSSYFGGEAGDIVNGATVTEEGVVYLVGETSSSTFPSSSQTTYIGPVQRGPADAFVAKLSPAMDLEWVLVMGGSELDSAEAVATIEGRVFVAGYTLSPDFPTASAVDDVPADRCAQDSLCASDGWLAEVTADGSGLEMSSYLGGDRLDQITDLGTSSAADIYIAGISRSRDLMAMTRVERRRAGGADVFVIRYRPKTRQFLGGTWIGGDKDEGWPALDTAPNGDVVVAASTSSDDFPLHRRIGPRPGGEREASLTRLSQSLSRIKSSSTFGGRANDAAWDVAAGSGGRISIVGNTSSRDFPTRRAFQSKLRGSSDAFVSTLNTVKRTIRFSTYLGGSDFDVGWGVVRAADRVVVVGETPSGDFPTKDGFAPMKDCITDDAHCTDAFIAAFGRRGRRLWSSSLGGSRFDAAYTVRTTRDGVTVFGLTYSPDFPQTALPQSVLAGPYDGFVARISL